jgi:hypothetical protein
MGTHSIYVIGFPKSGTSWLTRLVCDGLGARRLPGMPGDDEHVARTNFVVGREAGDAPTVRKTHLLPRDLAEFTGEEPGTGIYVYRDLRDVLISGFLSCHPPEHGNLLARRGGSGLRDMLAAPWAALKRQYWRRVSRRSFRAFVAGMCQDGWPGYGTWSEHIRQWRDYASAAADRRFAFLSYEELRADTMGALARAFELIGTKRPSPGHLQAVVERFSAERIYRLRSAQRGGASISNADGILAASNLRRGIVGDHRCYTTAAETALILRTAGEMLRQLGYVDSPTQSRRPGGPRAARSC